MTPFRVNNSFCEGSHVLTMAVYSLRVPIPSSEGYDIFQIILWLLIILQLRFLHEQDERQTYSQDFYTLVSNSCFDFGIHHMKFYQYICMCWTCPYVPSIAYSDCLHTPVNACTHHDIITNLSLAILSRSSSKC